MSTLNASAPKVGVRNTKQRTAVVSLLEDLDNFASAKDIHRLLQDREAKVGLTTVYRTLQSLAELEAVDVLHLASGETLYRSCHSDAHHHHLVCTQCGRTEEIDGGEVETWAKRIAKEYGYSLTGHDAEIYGVCSNCQNS